MPLLAGSDGCDPTAVDVPFLDPLDVSLRDLRVAFYTENGIAATDSEVVQVVRAAANALVDDVIAVDEARPTGIENAYDLEMKLLGADGGDGLRQYLASLGSTAAHPLLRDWLEKLEPYRTDLAGFAKYWEQWDQYRAAMLAFFSALRRDSVPGLHPGCAAARRFRRSKRTSAASATPWRTTWRDGRPRWSAAANPPRACRLPFRWWRVPGGRMWRWRWRRGWSRHSAAGKRRLAPV